MSDSSSVLSAQVKSRVREMIISGLLSPGQKLREVGLAQDLKVSRTPLREALIALEREGFLLFKPNTGFTVRPLSVSEVKELYPIIWSLEVLGLKLGFELIRADISALKSINADFERALQSAPGATEEDAKFHEQLLRYCHNANLQEMVRGLRQKLLRYERFFMSDPELVRQSVAQHQRIITAVERGEVLEAELALIDNWRTGMHSLIVSIENSAQLGLT